MSDHTFLLLFGSYLLGCLVWAMICPEETPRRPVKYWGDDGQWHYLPGEEPTTDAWDEYYTPHDI